MMKCRDIAEMSGDYIDKNMPWHQYMAVRLHLVMCTHCRRFVSNMEKAIAYFRQLPRHSLSEEDVRDIMAGIERRCMESDPAPPGGN